MFVYSLHCRFWCAQIFKQMLMKSPGKSGNLWRNAFKYLPNIKWDVSCVKHEEMLFIFHEIILYCSVCIYGFLSICNRGLPRHDTKPLIPDARHVKAERRAPNTEVNQGAIAQCEYCEITYQQNSSLPPQDGNPECSGHAVHEDYNGEVGNLWGICGA